MTAATRQEQLAAIFKAATVIPVLTIERLEDAVPLARALVGGGVRVLEVTLRTPVAVEAARAQGARRLLLGVYGENDKAMSFYGRQGFTRAGGRKFRLSAVAGRRRRR